MKNSLIISISEKSHKQIKAYYIGSGELIGPKELTVNNEVWVNTPYFEDITAGAMALFPRDSYFYKEIFFILPDYAITQDILKLPAKMSWFSVNDNIRGELKALHRNFDELDFGVSKGLKTSKSLVFYSYALPSAIQNYLSVPVNKQRLKVGGVSFRSFIYANYLLPMRENVKEDNLLVWMENGNVSIQLFIQNQLMGFYNTKLKFHNKLKNGSGAIDAASQFDGFRNTAGFDSTKKELPVEAFSEEEPSIEKAVESELSFSEKLAQADETLKFYTNQTMTEFSFYQSVEVRETISAKCFYAGGKLIAKLSIQNQTLYLHLSLSFADFDEKVYHYIDLSGNKLFHEVPFTVKVNSIDTFQKAQVLICENLGNIGIYSTVKLLVNRDLGGKAVEDDEDFDYDENLVADDKKASEKVAESIELCMEFARSNYSTAIDSVFIALDSEMRAIPYLTDALDAIGVPYKLTDVVDVDRTNLRRVW